MQVTIFFNKWFRPIDFGTVQNACKFQLKPTSMEKGLVHVHRNKACGLPKWRRDVMFKTYHPPAPH